MQYPKITQPTHARWEQVPSESIAVHTMQVGASDQANFVRNEANQVNGSADVRERTIFTQVPAVYTNKFMVTDMCYEAAPTSTLGYPGPDEALIDVDAAGLMHVPEEVVAELPSDCRSEFFKAKAQEKSWKKRWNMESVDKARGELSITYNV